MSERKSVKRTFNRREPMTLGQMAELVQAAREAKAPDDTKVKVAVNFSAGVTSAEVEW